MYVPFHGEGIISQFEGYEKVAELDREAYRSRYGNIQRLDLTRRRERQRQPLQAFEASRRADAVLPVLGRGAERALHRPGLSLRKRDHSAQRGLLLRRSSDGSTLSRVVHAWVLARLDRLHAMTCFAEALQRDVSDIQQGTAAEGVHLGAMAGTLDLVQRVPMGIEVRGDVLRLDPQLPQQLARVDMHIRYRGHSLDPRLTQDALTVRGHERAAAPIRLQIRDAVHEFVGGSTPGLRARAYGMSCAPRRKTLPHLLHSEATTDAAGAYERCRTDLPTGARQVILLTGERIAAFDGVNDAAPLRCNVQENHRGTGQSQEKKASNQPGACHSGCPQKAQKTQAERPA